jgi:hypothetical protein
VRGRFAVVGGLRRRVSCPSGKIGGEGWVEAWPGETGMAGQIGAHLSPGGTSAQRARDRRVEPKSAAGGERRVTDRAVHVVSEREPTRAGARADQPHHFGSFQRVKHGAVATVERRGEKGHVDLFAGDGGDVEHVEVAWAEPVEPVGYQFDERSASRTLACQLA